MKLIRYSYSHYARDITKLSLSELSSLLRLSTKYIFPSLREEIIAHLNILFPKTLDDFRSPARKKLLPPDFNGITGVNLGRECDVPSILPSALYLCSRMKSTAQFQGLTFVAPDTNEPESVQFLDKAVYHDCLRFQDQLADRVESAARIVISQRYRFCTSCSTMSLRYATRFAIGFTSSTFDYLATTPRPRPADCELCVDCWTTIRAVNEALRRAIWEFLPNLGG